MPAGFPYILNGIVYDKDGTTALSNIRVTVRNERSNKTLIANTDSSGFYAVDAANFEGSYNDTDILTIFVIYKNFEDREEHIIVAGAGGTTINLTLVEVPASDQLRYFTVQDYFDFFHFTAAASDTPSTTEVVKIGVMAEEELDRMCSTRFSDGLIEVEVDDCDATTGWSGSTDASAIAVTTTDGDYRTPTGALDLGKSGTTEAFFHYEKSSLTSRSFRDRQIAFWVYFSSRSALRTISNGVALTARYGSSSSDYYQKTWYKDDLLDGWNLLSFKSDDADVTTAGTPSIGEMTYFRIRFDNTAASDTVTSGNYILDNMFLAHEDHWYDEYLDTREKRQADYFLRKVPLNRVLNFSINRADEDQAPVWDELTEGDNEIEVDYRTGRVRVVDVVSDTTDGRNLFPAPGARQVHSIYLFGETAIPRDIKKLAILITARDLMQAAVGRAVQRGQDSFKTEHYTVFDSQIDRILSRYRRMDYLNT